MTDRPLHGESGDDEALAATAIDSIAAPLRHPVVLDERFERRVMEAVRGAHAPATAGKHRGYTVRVSPVTTLALAASLALAVVLGRSTARSAPNDGVRAGGTSVSAAAAARYDTVYIVRFVLVDPDARRVSLVGDFNGWTPDATPLTGQDAGEVWTASVPVTRGRHEYAFIVDGRRWVVDPCAAAIDDEFGTSSSVLHIGDVRHGSADVPPAI